MEFTIQKVFANMLGFGLTSVFTSRIGLYDGFDSQCPADAEDSPVTRFDSMF